VTESASLSARLRTQTKALHVQAERTGIMAQLLRGRATLPAYAALMVSLQEIYSALEDGLAAQASDPVLHPLVVPGFARATAIASDLRALNAAGVVLPPAAAEARSYAAHLRDLTRAEPARLMAHAWLRYLGDVNGGQIIGGIVRDSLGLPPEATQFYEFPALADPMAAASAWRVALDAAPFGEAMHDRIVNEACDGLRRHIQLFESLTPNTDGNGQDAADSSSAA
jgi:heme oxygenase (biliverdin-producing, ferredoxin)